MCTGIWLDKGSGYFGRTLDYDFSYGEEVAIAPRRYPFCFRSAGRLQTHFAMIGTAHVAEGYPLYYDAMNEKGLCMAGLNFVGNARYGCGSRGRTTVEQFELIPYLLGKCASVDGVVYELSRVRIGGGSFGGGLPAAQLHWLVADGGKCAVVESVEEGLKVYDNPVGVLTNNPAFDFQLFNLEGYRRLSAADPADGADTGLCAKAYSRGTGAAGLPGDWSSRSRFVRAAFVRENCASPEKEEDCVIQFFHMLGAVAQPKGTGIVGDGYEHTVYSCCCSQGEGVYYFKTYGNPHIRAVRLGNADLDGSALYRYPHGGAEERIETLN